MRGLGLAVAFTISCLLFISTPVIAAPAEIVVQGHASISAPPDFANIDVGVMSTRKTVAEAVADNNMRMSRVVKAISALGIDDANVKTSKFDVQAQHPRDKEYGYDETRIIGYTVANRVTITVRDLSKLASVIDATVAEGANAIGSVAFDIENKTEIEDRALDEAIRAAHRKAEIMAKAEGVEVGRVISMANEHRSSAFGASKMITVTAFKSSQTPLLPGAIDVSAKVTVTYAIK